MKKINRRKFIAGAAGAAAILAAAGKSPGQALRQPLDRPVRLGFVGTGNRGTGLIETMLAVGGVEIPAICDIDSAHIERAAAVIEKGTGRRPELYQRGAEDYLRLIERDDLDAVMTATPWELHTPVSVAAMESGKYAATEVPAALTEDECWRLVETSEKTGLPCMMLENECYYRYAMQVLEMIDAGLFGELLHCEAGYQHDVRWLGGVEGKIGPGGSLLWRGRHALWRNGNLYPTHPAGPAAWALGINRGDRFTYLVSMSTKSRGMNVKIGRMFGQDHTNATRKYALGDINTSLIATENGKTFTLYHDTQSPRPYDEIHRVQGTEGIYSRSLRKCYFEGRSPKEHTWEDIEKLYAQFDHPLWRQLGEQALQHGHDGADFLTQHQFLSAVRLGVGTPIDVYDSAAWSVISPLTERSVANRSSAVDFPDFTRGKWAEKREIPILGI